MAKQAPDAFRDETTVSATLKTPSARPLGLMVRVVAGLPDRPELRLHEGVCRVGAAGNNDLVINHPTVSRSHAELSLAPEGVRVRDLGSRNGTFYFGQRFGEMVLGLGARIQVGAVTLALEPDTEALLDGLEYAGEQGYRGILGKSPRMRKLFALLQRLESSLANVLVEGESGAGKEEIARAIHEGSRVAGGPLVVVNCGAIPQDLVASELFGHVRGAFTGAIATRRGAFDSAAGGTLFLDEIGELPLDVQPALLRAIELGEVRPVGGERAHRTTVRLVAATNRDLQAEVAAGRFRQDLFFRLAVVRIQAPPLRGHPEDIEPLARHFAAAAEVILPEDVLAELKSRPWPGNVRELKNAIDAYAAIGELPPRSPAAGFDEGLGFDGIIDPTAPYAEQKDRVIERFTSAYLKSLLRYTNGNQAAAARIGKLDRTHLGRLMNKYGLHVRKVD